MSNPRKAKGTAFERDVKGYANKMLGQRTHVHRPVQDQPYDVGDLHGVSPFIIQAKNWKNLVGALREGLDGAVKQAKNAGERWGVAVIKRHQRNVREAYTVMRLEDWLTFYREYLDLRAENERLHTRLTAYRERSTDEQPDHRPHRRG